MLPFSPDAMSESEYEGEEKVELELPQDVDTRGQMKGQRTKIRYSFHVSIPHVLYSDLYCLG